MAGWESADLYDKFLLYLGRGNGGTMDADELWTSTRVYSFLADAQETVYSDCAPIAPAAFVSAPVQLTTSDGGVTYTFPNGAYPFGGVEIYAQESGGRTLYATSYNVWGGDFVIEGATIRTPGNRTRTYASGPWARYAGMPSRISAAVEPSLQPEQARELILFRALADAADVSNGMMDNAPWVSRYMNARQRWLTLWQTQYRHQGTSSRGIPSQPWWLGLDAMNGAGS
jgi:hypothetical protein